MATESSRVKTRGDATITIEGAALSYEVNYEEGTWQSDDPKAEEVIVYDRNIIAGSRKGKQQVATFSFEVDMRQFADARANTPTIVDVVEFTNTWSGDAGVGGAAYEEPLHKVTYEAAGIANGDPADHAIEYGKCLLTWNFKEGDLNKIVVTGRCYTKPVRTGPS
jgi:hypothetical protein